MARGDHEAASRSALPHKQRNCRCRTGLVRQKNGSAAGGNQLGDGGSDAVRGEAMIVADDDALARVLAAYHVTGDGLGYHACVREGEVFGDNAAPAISSKSNRSHCP